VIGSALYSLVYVTAIVVGYGAGTSKGWRRTRLARNRGPLPGSDEDLSQARVRAPGLGALGGSTFSTWLGRSRQSGSAEALDACGAGTADSCGGRKNAMPL
jgi:hypothetical protein